jgi:hypothetical protein
VSDVRTAAKVMKDETGMMKKNIAMLQARMRAILTAWNASPDLITFSARHIASSHPAVHQQLLQPPLKMTNPVASRHCILEKSYTCY